MSAATPYHPEEYCSEDEVAARTGYAAKTLKNKRFLGEGPPYVKGPGRHGRVLYRWGDVVDWMEGQKRLSTSDNPPADLQSEKPGHNGPEKQGAATSRDRDATPAQPMAQRAA